MPIIKNIKLDIPSNVGEAFLKKLMEGELNPKLQALLDEKRELCIKNIYLKAIYQTYEIDKIENEKVYFKSGNIFSGPNISKILKGSQKTTIFIYTLGKKIDEIIKEESNSGDTLATIVMDAITTNILGFLGEQVGNIIKKEELKEDNWGSTCSYSPGQYRWLIEEQKEIFNMVDATKIGVNLNKSYLMVPFKSVSGLYGFGPLERIDKTKVACDLCPRENCIGRK